MRKRDKAITVRVSKVELDSLKKLATVRGCYVSDLVRWAVFNVLEAKEAKRGGE